MEKKNTKKKRAEETEKTKVSYFYIFLNLPYKLYQYKYHHFL